jgi:hypothetical protein
MPQKNGHTNPIINAITVGRRKIGAYLDTFLRWFGLAIAEGLNFFNRNSPFNL